MRGEIAARVLARLHVAGLAAGGQEDEHGDQHQQRIAHQAEEGEHERQSLPDGGGDPRGARVAQAGSPAARAARARRPWGTPGSG